MSKRKSSEVEELQRLKKRLKKLEDNMKKPQGRRRIHVIEDSSSSSDEKSRNCSPTPHNSQDGGIFDFDEPPLELLSETQPRLAPEDIVPRENLSADKNDGNRDETLPEADSSADTALDSIVLDILGEDPLATSDYGKTIHNQLANRLEHFATSGLTKDARKELSDKYLVPSNCTRIGAPILNAEIKAALPENLIKRDKAIEARQKLLAKAISCLASAVTDQLNRDDKNQELLKSLMDTGRLLCDIQHAESLTRRNFALFYVKKELKEHLSNSKIDKYLFGENLSEALKAAKAVSKSGTDLKQRTNYKKPTPSSQKPQAKNLNWKPPVPARRQQGPQRSQEPAQPRQPSSSSKPLQRPYRTTRRQ